MRRLAAILTVALLGWGCDAGPSGPGILDGVVLSTGTDLGGAVLQVVGTGIEGFSGVGGSRVYWAPVGGDDTYRVIVITESAGDLHFQVAVQDLGDRRPVAAVVNLVNDQNVNIPATSDFKVRFSH
jgi:hypothetical protein